MDSLQEVSNNSKQQKKEIFLNPCLMHRAHLEVFVSLLLQSTFFFLKPFGRPESLACSAPLCSQQPGSCCQQRQQCSPAFLFKFLRSFKTVCFLSQGCRHNGLAPFARVCLQKFPVWEGYFQMRQGGNLWLDRTRLMLTST